MSNMSSDALGKKREKEWADGKFLVLKPAKRWKYLFLFSIILLSNSGDSGQQKISVLWSELREERSSGWKMQEKVNIFLVNHPETGSFLNIFSHLSKNTWKSN